MIKLDYGCGSGGFEEIAYPESKLQSWLVANGGKGTFGIDINPLRIEKARERINNGVELIPMDGRNLAFPDNYFDVVHEWAVFHHMPDYEKGLEEIHRVLKPNGVLLLTESVDNDIAFRYCRRIFNKWHDDYVSTYFDSHRIDEALRKHFIINSRSYYWRFLPSDFLRQYNLEPRLSLIINNWISGLLNKMGIGEKFCCHYVVKAINYKKK